MHIRVAGTPSYLDPGIAAVIRSRTMEKRILLVEDDSHARRNVARFLEYSGFHVSEAENGEKAVDLIRAIDNFDVVITDLRMPGMIDGLDVLSCQSQVSPGTHAILVTGFGSKEIQLRANALGIVYMEKPLLLQNLLSAVKEVT